MHLGLQVENNHLVKVNVVARMQKIDRSENAG
jgi:hypothetical protein